MSSKSELYALVGELAAWRWTRRQIGEAVGRTPQRVGQILRLIRMQPFESVNAAVAALPPLLRERLREFQRENET